MQFNDKLEITRRGKATYLTGRAVTYFNPENAGTEYERQHSHHNERVLIERFEKGSVRPDVSVDCMIDHIQFKVGDLATGLALRHNPDVGWDYEIELNPKKVTHRQAREMAESGELTGSSFGFYRKGPKGCKYRWDTVNGKGVKVITDAVMFDVSPCRRPCYEASTVGLRAHIISGFNREFEEDWNEYRSWAAMTKLNQIRTKLHK